MKRIRLDNTFFEGLNNAYLFDGAGPTTLVDTGVATADARQQLEDGLATQNCTVADLDRILLTHWHADHVGLAGELQAESGATVHVHSDDVPLVTQDADVDASMRDHRDRLFDEWGMPDDSRSELVRFLDGNDQLIGDPPDVTPFEAGDEFAAGSETLTTMALPGHTSGLSGFVRDTDDGSELLSGDALLPVYTPNVGGADIRVEAALAKYLTTLAEIVTAEFTRAWPGHRDPIDTPAARAREIIAHHHERTQRVVTALADLGPADPWTVSAELFGELSNIHILHGPGEAHAHLEHLAAADYVEQHSDGYTLTTSDPDLESLFPDVGL